MLSCIREKNLFCLTGSHKDQCLQLVQSAEAEFQEEKVSYQTQARPERKSPPKLCLALGVIMCLEAYECV